MFDVDVRVASAAGQRWEALRDLTGRVATVAGAATVPAVLIAPDVLGAALVATGAATTVAVVGRMVSIPAGHARATAAVMHAIPGATLAVVLILTRLAGAPWVIALLMIWTAVVWVVRPAAGARQLMTPPAAADEAQDEARPGELLCEHPAAQWWAKCAAVKGGLAPGTALTEVERTGDRAMRMVIAATTPGAPVPDISTRHLSALMDIPEDEITIGPVPGRGAGVRLLTVGAAGRGGVGGSREELQQRLSGAMSGARITSIRAGRPGAPETIYQEQETTR
jgi:hypothetical protein